MNNLRDQLHQQLDRLLDVLKTDEEPQGALLLRLTNVVADKEETTHVRWTESELALLKDGNWSVEELCTVQKVSYPPENC